ncbi:unnamed protein product [Mytilus coruscus]|uniref:C-type lectin domain-containing protein n=1 Tax=Mytilus coruscus TaxID=42192 RepID=A0A6J8BGB6_MYTCO|nr:unnamed protein product [Mytilus coruscus]
MIDMNKMTLISYRSYIGSRVNETNRVIQINNTELTIQNVTFQNTKQTWKNAANFCSGKGGVLESNVTFLREQNEFKKGDVWLGKFRTLTNWTYIRDRLPNFGTAERNQECIATIKCDSGKYERSYENCNKNFNVICDSDAELGYGYGNYQAAAEECERIGSFIKWHSDNLCVLPGRLPEYWTSGTRHIETFLIRKAWTDDDKGDLISIPNLSIAEQKNVQSDNLGSIAAGTVTSIIVLIVAILVLLILRRRLSKEKPTIHESQNSCPVQDLVELHINNETSQAVVYHEIDGGKNSPQYEILNRYPAVSFTPYDCLNLNRTPEPENVYINTNSSAISISDSVETDDKFHEQKERVKQKKQNAITDSSEVKLNINHESSQAAA